MQGQADEPHFDLTTKITPGSLKFEESQDRPPIHRTVDPEEKEAVMETLVARMDNHYQIQQDRLKAKREQAAKQNFDKEVAENTFTPQVNHKRATRTYFSNSSSLAYEKYLMKQEHARQLREEVNNKAQKVFLTGSNWTGKPTVAQTPKMAKIEQPPQSVYQPASPFKERKRSSIYSLMNAVQGSTVTLGGNGTTARQGQTQNQQDQEGDIEQDVSQINLEDAGTYEDAMQMLHSAIRQLDV